MAFQVIPNSVVIGSQTFGADGNVESFLLPGWLGTGYSRLAVYYPDGRPTQRIGIIPDITVEPTEKDIESNKDVVLEKALSVIRKSMK